MKPNELSIFRSLGRENLERAIVLLLKRLGFTPATKLDYPYAADYVAYKKAPDPFELNLKYVVEVVHQDVQVIHVNRLRKAMEALSADRAILISTSFFNEESQAAATRLRIVSINGKELLNLLREYNIFIQKEKKIVINENLVAKYGTIQQIFSPYILADNLPLLAHGVTPPQLKEDIQDLNLQIWQVFEDAVYCIFNQVFGYNVERLGRAVLFEKEPEGVVLVDEPQRFAFVYECKSRSEAYRMSSDDALRYRDYICQKKVEVRHLFNIDLIYFVIIGPQFEGNIQERMNYIRRETGVNLVFFNASALRHCALESWKIPVSIRKLINFKDFFDFQEVKEENTKKVIEKFHRKYSHRYKP